MSLLLSEGHRHARRYPMATVWAEAEEVEERHRRMLRRKATLDQAVHMSIHAKGGSARLREVLKGL